MNRYDLITNYRCGGSIEEMEPSDDGEWVRYEEVQSVIAGYEQRLSLIRWWSESARAVDAVDPHVSNPGTPTTRVVSASESTTSGPPQEGA